MDKIKRILYESLIIILILGISFISGFLISSKINLHKKSFYREGNLGIHPASLPNLIRILKPSVVNISTTEKVSGHSFFEDDFFYRFFGDIPQEDFMEKSLGSGFIVNEEGYIITNNHVIENAENIKVKLYNGKEFDAKVIGRDSKTDIALIKIKNGYNLSPVVLGNSETLDVGDWAIAIGNPYGLEHTVTVGIVSGKGRVIGSGPYDDFIQTDASINPGNSGGPLFNINGEVVGINTAIISGGQGIGFAIPINVAKNLITQLKEKGSVLRGYIGVTVQELTPELSKSFGMKNSKGALISEVIKDGPAYKAGLKTGDILIKYNGKDINDFRELPKMVAITEIGKKVNIKIIRYGKEINFIVSIEELRQKDFP